MITDEDIRRSGARDLPTVLRRIPGLEVVQVTGADFNVSMRGDNQLVANKLLVLADGRSIYVDVQGSVFWKTIPSPCRRSNESRSRRVPPRSSTASMPLMA